MIICSVNGIAKSFGGNQLFKDLSLEIHEGKRVGLVGRNGCGKTTLMRMLAGAETIDEGIIHWKKGLRIGYLAQIPSFENLSVNEVLKTAFQHLVTIDVRVKEIEANMSIETDPGELQSLIDEYGKLQDEFTLSGGYEMDFELDRVTQGLQIVELREKAFSLLSGGEKTKVGLALSLLRKPDLLLLDEPTNHLDLMAVEWLGSFLKSYSGTIVLISHDRYFLDEVVTSVLDMEDGEIELYHTNFSGFIKEKEDRLLREFQEFQEQQKKIKKMKEAIKRLRDWANRSNPPSAGLHKRATNMQRALDRIEKLDRPKLENKKMAIDFEANGRSGKDVIVLKDVMKTFGNRNLFKDVNMLIQFKERVAIVGENGTGKSTLLKLMLKDINADHGIVKLGSNVKVGYLSQHVFHDIGDERLIDVFRSEVSVNEGEARHILAGFLFYGPAVFRKVNQLSGGERMRLKLAQLMYKDVNLLILDEPTNHLDIDSCEVLEDALGHFNGTVLAVSHDRYFLNKLFNKTYWLHNGKVYFFEGNYEWARTKFTEINVKTISTSLPVKKENVFRRVKDARDHTQPSPHELEYQLEELESVIGKLKHELEQFSELDVIQKHNEEIEKLEKQREELYDLLDSVS